MKSLKNENAKVSVVFSVGLLKRHHLMRNRLENVNKK